MNTNEYVDNLETFAVKLSKPYNEGDTCYPYAFGYLVSHLKCALNEVNLSEEQLKVLESRLNSVVNLNGV